jgi:MFS family permease
MSFGFMEIVTVLPLFLHNLTVSTAVIGLLITLQHAGWILIPLLVASYIQHRPRKKPFLVISAFIGRLPFLALALLVFTWGGSAPTRLLWLAVAIYTLFFFSDGMTSVPWQDILAKVIPPIKRGRCLGYIAVFGGLLAMISGEVVRRILADESIPFPNNYGLLFAFFAAGMLVTSILLMLIREPVRPVAMEAQSAVALVKQIPRVLREVPTYRRMVAIQVVLGMASIALPFYVLFAQARLGAPQWISGVYVWAGTLGTIIGSLVWGHLGDRFGNARVIRAVSWLQLLAPLTAIVVPLLGLPSPFSYYLFAAVFMLERAALNGGWIGFTNFVLELASDEQRPTLIGITTTLTAPVIFMPALGGLLLKFVSYEAVFAIAAITAAIGWFWARRLVDPRQLKTDAVGA